MRATRNPALWITLTLLAAAAFPVSGRAQRWTVEELEARSSEGFQRPGKLARWAEIGQLLEVQDAAAPAIVESIHGNHREYLLKIEGLIDRLTDQRWLERERAERTLTEIGARARELLRNHAKTGKLLEERLRCERIVDAIDSRGTEELERRVRLLRGLVGTAQYLDERPRLARALISALGHTDPEVVALAGRALGVHGRGADSMALVRLLDQSETLRPIALSSLARMPSAESLATCRELLFSGDLTTAEGVMMLRLLRRRPESRELIAALADNSDPALARAAQLGVPTDRTANHPVHLVLGDHETLDGSFLEVLGDGFAVSSAIPGLRRLEISFDECSVIDFQRPQEPAGASQCRVFLTQGSLITGALIGMNGDLVRVESPVFGTVEFRKEMVQGIATDPALDRLIGASSRTDRLRLRDNRYIDGTITAIDGDAVVLTAGDGSQQRVPLSETSGLLFRRPPQTNADPALFARIDLVSGDRVLAYIADSSADAVAVVAPILGTAVIPLADVSRIEFQVAGGALWGFTMIADYSDNRLIEVDEQGHEVFVMEEIYGAWDVECLENGNLLITEFSVSRVQELTREGVPVWSYDDLRNPYDADRLANGNTLIADTFRGRVIEVNPDHEIVWSYSDGIRPFDVERLANGNTLIADVLKDRVIEVDPAGTIVWERKNLPGIHDADRLPNGNTLITLRSLNRVIEIDSSGREVFRLNNLNAPSDADRLPNGNTIVAENNMVREFDRQGNLVWKHETTWAVEVNRY